MGAKKEKEQKNNSDVIISFRVDKDIHNTMQNYDEINWSAVLRKMLISKVKELQNA